MRLIKFLVILGIFPLIVNAQFPNNYNLRFKYRRVEGIVFPFMQYTDTMRSLNLYDSTGLILSHEQISDKSEFARILYLYHYDFAGRASNKTAILSNNKIEEVSLFGYYGESNDGYSYNLCKELNIHMINNEIDTFIYDHNGLMLSMENNYEKKSYKYNSKQDVTELIYHAKDEKRDSVVHFKLKYNDKGLLIEISAGMYKNILEYNEKGQLISIKNYADSVYRLLMRMYYD